MYCRLVSDARQMVCLGGTHKVDVIPHDLSLVILNCEPELGSFLFGSRHGISSRLRTLFEPAPMVRLRSELTLPSCGTHQNVFFPPLDEFLPKCPRIAGTKMTP